MDAHISGVPKLDALIYGSKSADQNFIRSDQNSNNRDETQFLLGRVQEGSYNFKVGHGTGLGFISLGRLSEFLIHQFKSADLDLCAYYFQNPRSTRMHPCKLLVVY